MAAEHRVKVTAKVTIERRARAVRLCQTQRLREPTDVRRDRTKHCHGLSVSFDHNFGSRSHACQERREVIRRFSL